MCISESDRWMYRIIFFFTYGTLNNTWDRLLFINAMDFHMAEQYFAIISSLQPAPRTCQCQVCKSCLLSFPIRLYTSHQPCHLHVNNQLMNTRHALIVVQNDIFI